MDTTIPSPSAGWCPRHTDQPTIGTCQRCGDFLCEVCAELTGSRETCPDCQPFVGGAVPPGSSFEITEVVEGTVKAYGSAFWTLVYLSALPILGGVVFVLVIGLIALGVYATGVISNEAQLEAALPVVLVAGGLAYIPFIVFMVWIQLRCLAASMHVYRLTLFRQPTPGVMGSFGLGAGHVLPLFITYFCVGLIVFAILSAVSVPGLLSLPGIVPPEIGVTVSVLLLLISLVFLVRLYLRWLLLAPVVVFEGVSGFDAHRRVRPLTQGNLLMIFIFALIMVGAGMLAGMPGFFVGTFIQIAGFPIVGLLVQYAIQFTLQVVIVAFTNGIPVLMYYGLRSQEIENELGGQPVA